MPPLSDDSVAMMDALGRVAHLSQWARAAWVAALVGPARGEGWRGKAHGDDFITVSDLAAQKVAGLKNPQQIRAYRDAWFAQRPADEYGPPQRLRHRMLTM